MSNPYTGPLPRPRPCARWGWGGFADSDAGLMLGPGWIAAASLAAWTPVIAGPAGFTAAVDFAGIPVAVLLGFFIQARGELAAEFTRGRSAQARELRRWEVILVLQGGAAIAALLVLVAYAAAAKGSDGGASGAVARWLAPLVAMLVVLAVGIATRLPHLVNRLRETPPAGGGAPTNKWRRALAVTVDAIAMGALSAVLLLLVLVLGWVGNDAALAIWGLAAVAVAMAGYQYAAAVLGRSAGMALAGLCLVDTPCPHVLGRRLRCDLRAFAYVAGTVVIVVGLWVAFSGLFAAPHDPAGVAALVVSAALIGLLRHGRGQRIHDVAAGTVVVHRCDAAQTGSAE